MVRTVSQPNLKKNESSHSQQMKSRTFVKYTSGEGCFFFRPQRVNDRVKSYVLYFNSKVYLLY